MYKTLFPRSSLSNESTTRQPQRQRILIIGAGISGLSLGLQFLRHASKFYIPVIFEKMNQFEDDKDVGFVINITPNGLHILKNLGINPLKEGFGYPMNRAELHDSSSELHGNYRPWAVGEGIFDDPASFQTVERAPLQRLLLKKYLALGGDIQFDKKLVGIRHRETHHDDDNDDESDKKNDDGNVRGDSTYSSTSHADRDADWKVEAIFEDGSFETGELLVGADGVHSRVRKHLFSALPPDTLETPTRWRRMKNFVLEAFGHDPYFERIDDRLWEASPTKWTAVYGITSTLPKELLNGDEEEETGVGTMHWYIQDSSGGYSTYPMSNNRVFWVIHQVEPPESHEKHFHDDRRHFTHRDAVETMQKFASLPYLRSNTTFSDLIAHTQRVMKVRVWHSLWNRFADERLNIALVGNAAHPMPIYLGQGAVMGLEESVVLVNGLLRKRWTEVGLWPPPNYYEKQKSDLWWSPLQAYNPWWRNDSRPNKDSLLVGVEYYENERRYRCKVTAGIAWFIGWFFIAETEVSRLFRDVVLYYILSWMLSGSTPKVLKKIDAEDDNDLNETITNAHTAPLKTRAEGITGLRRTRRISIKTRKMKEWDHWLFDVKYKVDEEVVDLEI